MKLLMDAWRSTLLALSCLGRGSEVSAAPLDVACAEEDDCRCEEAESPPRGGLSWRCRGFCFRRLPEDFLRWLGLLRSVPLQLRPHSLQSSR
eukprot:6971374-Alexandrium_andersonii.AAC.1